MILGHGANTMTMEEAKAKLCAQAKYVINWLKLRPLKVPTSYIVTYIFSLSLFFPNLRILGRDCNAELMQHHFFGGSQDETGIQQSKDAIIYVTVSVRYTYLGTTKA